METNHKGQKQTEKYKNHLSILEEVERGYGPSWGGGEGMARLKQGLPCIVIYISSYNSILKVKENPSLTNVKKK